MRFILSKVTESISEDKQTLFVFEFGMLQKHPSNTEENLVAGILNLVTSERGYKYVVGKEYNLEVGNIGLVLVPPKE